MIKLTAFITRGFLHASSYRLNFIGNYLGSVLVMIFYAVLAQFYGLARPASLAQYGGDYFTFLLIGGVFSRYLSLGMRNFGRELEHEMLSGTIEPLMVTPTHPALALLGPSLWSLIEGVVLVIVQLIIGAIFFNADFSQADWFAALILSALTFIALNSWGILAAAFVIYFKRADPLSWLVDVTLYMLAGVYFPVEILPPALRLIAYLLPLSHALEGLRFALMRGDNIIALSRYVIILLIFNAILIPISLFSIRYVIDQAKRMGSLGHY